MNEFPSSRRDLLAGGLVTATAATAGCLGVFVREESNRGASASELELDLTREEGPLHESYVVDGDDPPEDWADGALTAAIAGAEFTTRYRKPFHARAEDPVYARHDGTYYELGSVIVDEVTERRPILRLSIVEEATDTSATSAENLPEGDRNAVRVAHMAARARDNVGGIPHGLVQRGGYVYRDPTTVEESVLLAGDGPGLIEYRDRVHEVSVARERFHEPVYRATAERVAESPERMEAILRARFVDARFDRDDLSDGARDVFRDATTETGHAESHPYSDGYAELLTAMHKRPYLDGNVEKDAGRLDGRGTILVDGEYLDYWLAFVGASSDD